MDDELKDAIKEVCAVYAINLYQATGITPVRDQAVLDKAKDDVKKHIKVEDTGAVIIVRFDMMGLIAIPPFYGMIPATIMTPQYKKRCDQFFSQTNMADKKFSYQI